MPTKVLLPTGVSASAGLSGSLAGIQRRDDSRAYAGVLWTNLVYGSRLLYVEYDSSLIPQGVLIDAIRLRCGTQATGNGYRTFQAKLQVYLSGAWVELTDRYGPWSDHASGNYPALGTWYDNVRVEWTDVGYANVGGGGVTPVSPKGVDGIPRSYLGTTTPGRPALRVAIDLYRSTSPSFTGNAEVQIDYAELEVDYKAPRAALFRLGKFTQPTTGVVQGSATLRCSSALTVPTTKRISSGSSQLRASAMVAVANSWPDDLLDCSDYSIDYPRDRTYGVVPDRAGESNGGRIHINAVAATQTANTTSPKMGLADPGYAIDNTASESSSYGYTGGERWQTFYQGPSGATGNAYESATGANDNRTRYPLTHTRGMFWFSFTAPDNSWPYLYYCGPVFQLMNTDFKPVVSVHVTGKGASYEIHVGPEAPDIADWIDRARTPEDYTGISFPLTDAGSLVGLEYAARTGTNVDGSGNNVQVSLRGVHANGHVTRWYTKAWTANGTDSWLGPLDSWEFGNHMGKCGAVTNRPNVWNAFYLAGYWHARGESWWHERELNGYGKDRWGPKTRITALKASGVAANPGGWTTAPVTTWPTDYASTTYVATTNKAIVYDVEDPATPITTALAMVMKATAFQYGNTDNYSLGLYIGSADASNNPVTVRQHDVRGESWISTYATPVPPPQDTTQIKLYLRSGHNNNSFASPSWRVNSVGAYVAHAPVATTGVSVSTSIVTSQSPRAVAKIDTGGVISQWKVPTPDSAGMSCVPVWADYNPRNGKVYVAGWYQSVYVPAQAIEGAVTPATFVAELDPSTGAFDIIWRANETASSDLRSDGGPQWNNSGTWTWAPPTTYGQAAMAIHFLRVDKHENVVNADGTLTANPFYGHVFCSFVNSAENKEFKEDHFTLWIDPTQGGQSTRSSTKFAKATKMLALPVGLYAQGTANGSTGCLGLTVTESHVFTVQVLAAEITRYNWLDKRNFAASGRWTGGLDGNGRGIGRPVPAVTDDYPSSYTSYAGAWGPEWGTVNDETGSIATTWEWLANQLVYAYGYVWVSHMHLHRLDPWAADIGASLTTYTISRGYRSLAESPINYNGLGTRFFAVRPRDGKLWASVMARVQVTNPIHNKWFTWLLNTATLQSSNGVVEINSDGTVGRISRIPAELSKEAPTGTEDIVGEANCWSPYTTVMHFGWADADTLVVSVVEAAQGTKWPRTAWWAYRPDRNEWTEIEPPVKDWAPTGILPEMRDDSGRWLRTSPPATTAPASRVSDPTSANARTIWGADQGMAKTFGGTTLTYKYDGGSVHSDSPGWTYRMQWPGHVLAHDEIAVDFTLDLTGQAQTTGIDEWAVEVGNATSMLEQGALVDAGSAVTAVSSIVRFTAVIDGTEMTPGEADRSIALFYRQGSVWYRGQA